VIRALRDCLRRPEFRRIVCIVALVAFVLVVVLGAAHAGEKHEAGHDHCGVCDAVAAIGTSESYAAPRLTAHVIESIPAATPDASVVVAAEPRRSHASRAPPSLA
jgi:hypothetical protein